MSLIWNLALLIMAVLRGSDGLPVTQIEGTLTITEGEPISVKCTYDVNIYYVYWYIQTLGQTPRLFLSEFIADSSSEGALRGFNAEKVSEEKSYNMEKPSSQLNDAAVYFCAGSRVNSKLIFGSGTRLLILPYLPEAEPSVYELKPANKETTTDISACLFTDYSPGAISVGINKDALREVNSSIVVVKENGEDKPSYGTVRWGKKDDKFLCSASHRGKDFTEDKNVHTGDCVKQNQETTPSPAPTSALASGPAPAPAPAPAFETDEQLNLLSLTVLGLRVIFLKSVAFNLLFTFRLWSS